jgi:hypothetical protein
LFLFTQFLLYDMNVRMEKEMMKMKMKTKMKKMRLYQRKKWYADASNLVLRCRQLRL